MAGIKDIAERVGVSIGTVDRALHSRPGINADTCARVLAAAQKLGYRPNLAARKLRSGKHARISVHLPSRKSLFWEALCDGVREAAAPHGTSLSVEFHRYASASDGGGSPPRPWPADTDALIVAPDHLGTLAPLLDEAAKLDIPVAYVGDDVGASPRILSVAADPFGVGALAGELVGRFVPGGGDVALVADSLVTPTDAKHLRGFVSSLSTVNARLGLAAILESHADEREVCRRLQQMLRAYPDLKAIYISAVDPLPVLRAIEAERRLDGLTVVVAELLPELFDWIRTGTIAASIHQRPLTQGRVALQLLYDFLQTRVSPTPSRRIITPYAVMSSNLDGVLERLEFARVASPTSWLPPAGRASGQPKGDGRRPVTAHAARHFLKSSGAMSRR
jgi:LacI family transcriptional regulator